MDQKLRCSSRYQVGSWPAFRKPLLPCQRSQTLTLPSRRKSPRTCFEAPFGEVVRATGPMAEANPFRFSTKYQDDETDLLYYGFRYDKDGRWLSRDLIGEPGASLLNAFRSPGADPSEGTAPSEVISGPNLYCFVGNDALNAVDALGLRVLSLQEVVQKSHDNLPAGIRDDITPCVMVALLWKESGFDTTAANPNSSARGIAQILNRPADDVQDRIAKNFGGSDPFYTLAKGERLRNNRFNPDVSIFAAYIYLDDRYRATGSLAGSLRAYGPGGASVLVGAECLCSKCGGFSYNTTTGAISIKNEQAAWDCLHAIHQD